MLDEVGLHGEEFLAGGAVLIVSVKGLEAGHVFVGENGDDAGHFPCGGGVDFHNAAAGDTAAEGDSVEGAFWKKIGGVSGGAGGLGASVDPVQGEAYVRVCHGCFHSLAVIAAFLCVASLSCSGKRWGAKFLARKHVRPSSSLPGRRELSAGTDRKGCAAYTVFAFRYTSCGFNFWERDTA
jgi:hypothetical protein